MEGVEYQVGAAEPPSNPHLQSLSAEQQVLQAYEYRESEESLKESLQAVEDFFSKIRPGNYTLHTGDADCERCTKWKRRITQAYTDYYLGNEPHRWDVHLSDYREEIRKMINDPAAYSLEDIHARYQRELRSHLKKVLCTVKRGDSKEIIDKKVSTSSRIDSAEEIKPILESYLDFLLGLSPPGVAEATRALQTSKGRGERIPIYVKYYCTPTWDDTPQQKSMKAKYARQFEAGLSHDEVLGAWKKEVLHMQQEEISKLKHRLGELQMAQSAHLKNKAKKAEKDQRMHDRDYVFVPKLEACSLESCGREVDVSAEGGAIQCAVCDWLARRDETNRRRFFYCGEDHAEEDFDEHDRRQHACTMGNRCAYHPEPGPEGETGAGGVCPDCMDEGYASYFCSQECYEANLEAHRDTFHDERGVGNTSNQLDMFRPEHDLEITMS